MSTVSPIVRNRLLLALPVSDLGAILPRMEEVTLRQKQVLTNQIGRSNMSTS